MKAFRPSVVILVGASIVCLMSALATRGAEAQSFGERFRKALDEKLKKPESEPPVPSDGPNSLDKAGLRNILPQWDPRKRTSEQFPHVAVTVLKVPAMWTDPAHAGVAGEGALVAGCFTLEARIWSDPQTSKVVGPFDWCSPRDSEMRPGILSSSSALADSLSSDLLDSHERQYRTGLERTEGPRPPDTIAPNDPQTRAFVQKNNTRGALWDLSGDTSSRFGHMFFNLRIGMGQVLNDSNDRRVWIVQIMDPARPVPAVVRGTISAPEPSVPAGRSSSVSASPAATGTQTGVPCPVDPAVLKQLATTGYKCVDGSLVAGAPAVSAGSAQTSQGVAFSAGDVLTPKIANVKVLAEPRDDAKTVATLSQTDDLVVVGAERNGFIQVQGSTSAGWVKTVLLNRR